MSRFNLRLSKTMTDLSFTHKKGDNSSYLTVDSQIWQRFQGTKVSIVFRIHVIRLKFLVLFLSILLTNSTKRFPCVFYGNGLSIVMLIPTGHWHLSQDSPFHTTSLPFYFFRTHINISLRLSPGFAKRTLLFAFPHKNPAGISLFHPYMSHASLTSVCLI